MNINYDALKMATVLATESPGQENMGGLLTGPMAAVSAVATGIFARAFTGMRMAATSAGMRAGGVAGLSLFAGMLMKDMVWKKTKKEFRCIWWHVVVIQINLL